MQEVLAAARVDAPGDKQCFFRAVAAQRLEHGIDEQVLHLDLGQVPADERLVVLPRPVGDLTDRALGDQQLTGRVAERVLHIPGGQSAGIHLGDQPIEHLTVAVQEAHQRRSERRPGAADLRHRYLDPALRGTDPTRLIAVPRTGLTLDPALVPTTAAQVVSLLGLQQLLHHQPGHRLHQHRDHVRLAINTTSEQLTQLLLGDHGRRYPSHRPAPLVGP
jgi:hypothetical protein